MDENRVGVFEPDNESLVVQYLKDFAYTLGELEVSFRGVEESRELIMGALQAAGHFLRLIASTFWKWMMNCRLASTPTNGVPTMHPLQSFIRTAFPLSRCRVWDNT